MSSKPFDATLKDLIEADPAAWPTLCGARGFHRAMLIDADVSTVSAAADKVFRLQADTGDWLLNLEPQSSYDAELPQRLHLYATLLHQRYALPVRTVALLLRREANVITVTGEWQLKLPQEPVPYLVFRYGVLRVWQLPLEPLLQGDLGTLPLAPLTDEGAVSLSDVVGRVEQRLQAEVEPKTANKLRAATFVLLGLRYPAEVAKRLYEGVTSMEESTTYQFIVSKGVAKGIPQGEKKILLLVGGKKFGPPDEATLRLLEGINDPARLEQLSERLLEVNSWQELLATPAE